MNGITEMLEDRIPAEEAAANSLRRLISKGEVDNAILSYKNWLNSHGSSAGLRANLGKKVFDALESSTETLSLATSRATLFVEAGFTEEAERCLREEARVRPTAHVIGMHASIMARVGKHQQSLDAYNKAIAMAPSAGNLHFERGRLLQSLARHAEAREALHRACSLEPTNADYLLELGNALKTMQDLTGAEEAYSRAISARPDYAEAYNNRGTVRRQMRQLKGAYADFGAAITKNPLHLYAYLNRGALLIDEGQYDYALKDFEYALVIAPDSADAYHGLSEVLHKHGRHSDALAHIDAAFLLDARGGRYHFSRGNYLRSLGRPEEAAAAFRSSTETDSSFLEGYINWSVALQDLNRHREAIEVLDRALAIRPEYNEASYNKANSMLCLGLSREAWQTYERRHHLTSGAKLTTFGKPLLGQETPQGKVLLLQWDQRVGDIIHAMRYVPLIEQIAAKCYWQVDHQLKGLLSASHPRIQMIGLADCPADVTHRLPITSLPLALGTFDDNAVPRNVPYLTPSEHAINSWRGRLQGDRPRVGVVWRGRPEPPGRSIPIQNFRVLFANPEIEFVSLQIDPARDELAVLNSDGVTNAASGIANFDDTAAIISLLDLVVTIDTSVAHLSCALGRPTWILLKYGGDWRWRETGGGSVWYPTARIYRQKTLADWPTVISELSSDLQQFSLRCC